MRSDALGVLLRSEAVSLFLARARAITPEFALTPANAPVIAEICARLDGLPLAIELAAAWTRLLPPQALLARLSTAGATPLHLLAGGPRDLPSRQQTLRDTIDWSYSLLTADERALFRQLAVFVGGCALEAVEAVWQAAGGQSMAAPGEEDGATAGQAAMAAAELSFSTVGLLEGLGGLVDKSLIRQVERADGGPRLTMLQTIREFAEERLIAGGEAGLLRGRHAAYYLGLAETAERRLSGPEQRAWLDRLDEEHANLRAALRWLLDEEDATSALRLAGALWRFWFMRGYLGEGLRWLEAGLAGGQRAPLAVRAKALTGAGVLAHYRGDYGRAAALCGESLARARQGDDRASIAAALNGMALVARSGGNYSAARAMYEESLVHFQATFSRMDRCGSWAQP